MISNMQQEMNMKSHIDRLTIGPGAKNIIMHRSKMQDTNNNNNDWQNNNGFVAIEPNNGQLKFTFEQMNPAACVLDFNVRQNGGETLLIGTNSVIQSVGNATTVAATVQQTGNGKTPAHHARRPMNAFLIFCKRHRTIVREKYPNLENRAITKILGDWWASLDGSDKLCYTNLAKDYKDAFFTANPDFKWYKLPAPPLRATSITTRPQSTDESDGCDENSFTQTSPTNAIDYDKETEVKQNLRKISTSSSSNVSMFKLADETQMGGLNSLMMAAETISNNKININYRNGHSHSNGYVHHAIKSSEDIVNQQNALQRELGEMTTFLKRTMNTNNYDHLYSSNPYHQLIDYDDPKKVSNIPNHNSDDCISSNADYEYEDGRKRTRSCKGKRYLEFMHCKSSPVVRKSKARTISTSSSSSSSVSLPSPNASHFTSNKQNPLHAGNHLSEKMDLDISDHLYAATAVVQSEQDELPWTPSSVSSNDTSKTFDASDFNLEEKINTLPALCLDNYLAEKRNPKKKKKIGGSGGGVAGGRHRHLASKNRKNGAQNMNNNVVTAAVSVTANATKSKSPKTIEEAKQQLNVVGSQKRKARKESITRREINKPVLVVATAAITTTTNSGSNNHYLTTVNSPGYHTEPTSITYSMPIGKYPKYTGGDYIDDFKSNSMNAPNNLFILATMAEQAASFQV